MSDFLAAEGIPTLERLSRRAHHRRPRPRRRRQRDLARQPRARGSARSQDPLLLAARSDSRALPLGRAVDRHRRHARQDDDDLADRLAADARRRRSERARRRHRAQLRRAADRATASASGRDFVIEGDEYDSAFFDKTAKFLKYLPDIAVINNVEFDHADIYADLDAVTLAFRRLVNLVPRTRPAAARRRQPGRARARRDARCRACETFGTGRRRRLAGARHRAAGRARRGSRCGAAARRSARSRCRCVGAHNVRNALAAIAVATEVGISAERIADGLRPFAGVKRRLEVVGIADGVTVYDDFAHHPTAVAETLAGAARVASGRAHLGGLRAALGLVVPPRVPGRLRARVRRRRRGADRAGLPLDAAGGGAAVGAAARSRSARRAASRRARPDSIDDIVDDHRRASIGPAISSCDVERRLRRHPPEAAASARVAP